MLNEINNILYIHTQQTVNVLLLMFFFSIFFPVLIIFSTLKNLSKILVCYEYDVKSWLNKNVKNYVLIKFI